MNEAETVAFTWSTVSTQRDNDRRRRLLHSQTRLSLSDPKLICVKLGVVILVRVMVLNEVNVK